MERAFNDFAAVQGYGIVCKSSSKQRNGRSLVYYQCDRGGKIRNRLGLSNETRKRVARSKCIDCPFQLIGKEYEGYWDFKVQNAKHNHDPSTHSSAHPVHLRLRSDISKTVVDLYESGVQPRNIQSHVRKVCDGVDIPARTIYNRCQQASRAKLDGRTTMDALVRIFRDLDVTVETKVDAQHQVSHLFWAHPHCADLGRLYNNVLLVDATYKTNGPRLPLLHIVGCTALYTTFSVAFVFMASESEESYNTALTFVHTLFHENHQPRVFVIDRELALMSSINIIFPKAQILLCYWHIEKNIVKNCKPMFRVQKADDTSSEYTSKPTSGDQQQEEWNNFMQQWKAVSDCCQSIIPRPVMFDNS